ncbi:MAG: ADOP family duplicated permease [Gemmatimonadales bacterium]
MSIRTTARTIAQDLRHGVRLAMRRPAFTAIVVATFALGIGATTAMFAVINTVLIQPMPYPQAGRLVLMMGHRSAVSVPDFLDYQARNNVFTSLSIWGRTDAALTGTRSNEQLAAMDVSTNFFTTLGLPPVVGRAFTPDDESRSTQYVMLSHGLWRRQFGGDPSVVGRTVVIDGVGALVLGVVPDGLDPMLAADIYRPFDFNSGHASERAYHTQLTVGRLKPGVDLGHATAAMNLITNQLAATYAGDKGYALALMRYQDFITRAARSQLRYLAIAVGLVLLIACGNIASLMLARTADRHAELATRVALGASRRRLLQHLIAEGVLFATMGGAFGLVLAIALLGALRGSGAVALPRLAELRVSPLIWGFTAAVSLLAGVVVGIVSALHATAAAVQPALNIGGRGSRSRRSARLKSSVVVMQITASLVLTWGAAVLMQSFWKLVRVDPGFDPNAILEASIQLPQAHYKGRQGEAFWEDFLRRVRALPHVASAAAASQLPLMPGGDASYRLESEPADPSRQHEDAQIVVVSDDYFREVRIPIVRGAAFDSLASAGDYRPVIISQTVARSSFPFEDPIGKHLVFPDFGSFTGVVVGVAGDVRDFGLGVNPPAMIYFPSRRFWGWAMKLVIRTDNDPTLSIPSLRTTLARVDPNLVLGYPQRMTDVVGASVAHDRIDMIILASFGGIALLLAALGLYGLLAYAVNTRAQELSIRAALGAQHGQLFAMVVRDGMKLVAIGLACGGVTVPLAFHVLRSGFNVAGVTATPWIASVVVLGLVGFGACILPGLKATRLGSTWIRVE